MSVMLSSLMVEEWFGGWENSLEWAVGEGAFGRFVNYPLSAEAKKEKISRLR